MIKEWIQILLHDREDIQLECRVLIISVFQPMQVLSQLPKDNIQAQMKTEKDFKIPLTPCLMWNGKAFVGQVFPDRGERLLWAKYLSMLWLSCLEETDRKPTSHYTDWESYPCRLCSNEEDTSKNQCLDVLCSIKYEQNVLVSKICIFYMSSINTLKEADDIPATNIF